MVWFLSQLISLFTSEQFHYEEKKQHSSLSLAPERFDGMWTERRTYGMDLLSLYDSNAPNVQNLKMLIYYYNKIIYIFFFPKNTFTETSSGTSRNGDPGFS